MAEFLAIAGGMAAVVQLAGTGRRFFKTLHRFAMNAGSAGAEVERFANQVRTFSDAVELAEQTLSTYCREHPKSPLVAYIWRRKILANIDSEARAVRLHLRDIQARVVNMESRSVLWASLKWTINKSSILELSPEMESVKTSLGLLMATAQFEDRMMGMVDGEVEPGSEESNKKLEKQMRRLQRVIKHHLRTMQDLRTQLDYIRNSKREASLDSLDHELMGEDALTELGWSIYECGTIPISPETSPSSSVMNHSGRPRGTHGTSPRPSRSTTRNPVRSAPQVSPEPPDPPPNTGPTFPCEQPPNPPLLNKTLRYRQENVDLITTGYMNNQSGNLGWHRITASLVESMGGNIMSIHKARELGLDIEAPSLVEKVMFDFGTGRLERSFGKTTFKWKPWERLNPRYPPIIVTCDVCENSTVGLIFGKPFVEEVERCWSEDKMRVLRPLR